MRIKITADSTSDIPQALCREWGIDLLPLYVVRDGQALKDGLEITPDDIYAHVSAHEEGRYMYNATYYPQLIALYMDLYTN